MTATPSDPATPATGSQTRQKPYITPRDRTTLIEAADRVDAALEPVPGDSELELAASMLASQVHAVLGNRPESRGRAPEPGETGTLADLAAYLEEGAGEHDAGGAVDLPGRARLVAAALRDFPRDQGSGAQGAAPAPGTLPPRILAALAPSRGPELPAGTGEPEGTCNCQEPSQSPLNPRRCQNCGYQLNDEQLDAIRAYAAAAGPCPGEDDGSSPPMPRHASPVRPAQSADTTGVLTGRVISPVPSLPDAAALDQIQEWLRDPEWGVGMLEDIADVVCATGRSVEDYPDGRPTWGRH